MSETMKAALDAALRFHKGDDAPLGDVIQSAKDIYRELLVTPPGAAEDWDESWFSRVGTWLATLSGDQLGSVRGQLANLERSRQPVMVAQPPSYASVPPVHQEAWALLDKLNGPQPYPGTPAPIGPLVTRDELEQRLAELGGDRNNAGDVEKAAGSWRDRTLAPEPAAISEALDRRDGETLLAAAERVMSELAGWKIRAEHAEARVAEARPIAPPLAEAGSHIRIRTRGADVYTSTTVATELEYSPTEGFFALVPPGAFAEGRRDEIGPESAARLLKLLEPLKLRGTLWEQVRELVETVERQRQRIQELETGRETFETQLRRILDADDEWESDDGYQPRQSTTEAAEERMKELAAAEARVRLLVWELTEERIEHQGQVRYFNAETEPGTVDVVKLIAKPDEKEISGGYLIRLGTGWAHVQRKPEQMPVLDGTPWVDLMRIKRVRARELTLDETKRWEES